MRRNRSKKRLALCLLLALALMLAPAAWAEENYDTLADWDIRVKVPDGKTAVLQGGEYYIYAGAEGYIPYVMLRAYRYDSAEGFLADFTDYMRGEYDDLTVTQEATPVTIGDKSGFEIIYFYRLSGYEVKDRRVAVKHGERVYMFASKEIEALGQTVGTMLEDVITDSAFLAEPAVTPDAPEETVYSPGYLYTLPNGMPKYFVDFSGEEADDVVLHCWFRSGDPTFYSSAFVLHLDALKNSTLLYRGMNNVKFRSVVKPGDACVITARLVESKGNLYVCDAQLSVAGKRCCQGTLTIATVPAGD